MCAIASRVLAGVCAKKAGIATSDQSVAMILINPWYLAELFFLFLQAISWIFVLRELSLGFAYPFMSTTIVLSLLAAYTVFGEPITLSNLLGVALIVAGVLAVSRSSH